MGGNVFIVTAPSGAGKTSLVHALVKAVPEAAISVSHTTRSPRPGEIADTHYHFVDVTQFEAMIERGEFLEHANVFGNYYGTSVRSVESLIAADREVILEIDWQGAEQIKRKMPSAIGIFVLPPSLQTLKKRLDKRAQDAPEVIARRLAEARAEIAHHESFDYLVVNDRFEVAVEDMVAIVRTARLRAPGQRKRLQPLLSDLLNEV